MATSLAVPIAYITVLVTAMAIFSRIYRRRRAGKCHHKHNHNRIGSGHQPRSWLSKVFVNKTIRRPPERLWPPQTCCYWTCETAGEHATDNAAEKTSFEPWFPAHPARDIYITLLSADPPVPESMLKSALLVRATADVKRIWRIKEDKQALASLHQRGLVGDDTMARFAAAEKELEAEIVDVVSEANTFRNGWGSMIFATASEMAHSEKTRDTVISVGRARQLEGESAPPPPPSQLLRSGVAVSSVAE